MLSRKPPASGQNLPTQRSAQPPVRPFEVTYPGQELASSPTNPFPQRLHEVSMGNPAIARKPSPDSKQPDTAETSQPELDWNRISLYAEGQTPPVPPNWNRPQGAIAAPSHPDIQTAPVATPPQPQPDTAGARERALEIKDALLEHLTEDEQKALDQIRGQSLPMLRAIRQTYLEITGHLLIEDFEEYCDSDEFKEALTILMPVMPLLDRLKANVKHGWVFDTENESGILEVLRRASEPDLIAGAANSDVDTFLKDALDDDDYYEARKLLAPGDMYNLVVNRIKAAPGTLNDDESGAYNALLDLTPAQRQQLWQEHQDLFSFMNDEELATARKMCLGTEAEALKARMEEATDGAGTDDPAVKLVVAKTQSIAQEEQALQQAVRTGRAPSGEPLTIQQLQKIQTRLAEMGGVKENLLTPQYDEDGDLKSGTFLEMLHGDVSSAEYQAFTQTMGLDQLQRAKQKILDAPGTLNDDEDAIYEAFDSIVGTVELPPGTLPSSVTPEQRAILQQAATQRLRQQLLNDPEVRAALGCLNDDEMDIVHIYTNVDTYKIAIRRLEKAYEGVDADEAAIFKVLTSMSAGDRAKLKTEQPDIYQKIMNPRGALNAEERKLAQIAVDTGKIPTEQALDWALGGSQTDAQKDASMPTYPSYMYPSYGAYGAQNGGYGSVSKEMLAQTFEAMSEAERYQYRLGYYLYKKGTIPANTEAEKQQQQAALAKFQSLYQRMDSKLGTDDLQTALDQLLGTPTLEELKTTQGRLMAARMMYERVGEKGDIRENDNVSSAVMDYFSDAGGVSDQSEARFVSAYQQAMADGVLTDAEFAALAVLDKDFAEKYQEYVIATEQVANIAATVAAIAVGIVAAVLTGGGSAPATAALLAKYAAVAGLAGAITKVGVTEAIAGEHYDAISAEGLKDAAAGFADGAMSVLAVGLAKRFTDLVGLGKTALSAEMTAGILAESNAAVAQAGKTFARAGVQSAIEGALSGAVGEIILTTADEKTWKQGIWDVILSYGSAILKGGGIGAVTGAVTGGSLEAIGDVVKVKQLQGTMQRLEASGVNPQRLRAMSVKTVEVLGEIVEGGPRAARLVSGETAALEGLVKEHGNWKGLVDGLMNGGPETEKVAANLGKFRSEVVKEMESLGAKPVGGASTLPTSDVDINVAGENAGQIVLALEQKMAQRFGPKWSESLYMNFYTEASRSTQYEHVIAALPAEARAKLQQRMTDLTEKFTFAKMLEHAGDNKESVARVESLIKTSGKPHDLDALRALAHVDHAQKRAELLLQIDQEVQAFNKLKPDDLVERANRAQKISELQMEANFYSKEAYIGPGATRMTVQGVSVVGHEAYQAALSNLEMIEHVLNEMAGGSIVKACREYELFKYINRYTQAARNAGVESPGLTYFEHLSEYIYRRARGAQSAIAHTSAPAHLADEASDIPVTEGFLQSQFNQFRQEAQATLPKIRAAAEANPEAWAKQLPGNRPAAGASSSSTATAGPTGGDRRSMATSGEVTVDSGATKSPPVAEPPGKQPSQTEPHTPQPAAPDPAHNPLLNKTDAELEADSSTTPRAGETQQQANERVRLASDERLRRAMERYHGLGDQPPHIDIKANDATYSDAHTGIRHGPDIPMERQLDANGMPNGVRTVEGRIYGDPPWDQDGNIQNFSAKWISEDALNQTVNRYLKKNWEQIRSDLATGSGEHRASFDAGEVIGRGYYNANYGKPGVAPQAVGPAVTPMAHIALRRDPGNPSKFYIITTYPTLRGF